MPQAEHPHVAPDQIHGKGQQGVGQVLAQQGDQIARHMQGAGLGQQAAAADRQGEQCRKQQKNAGGAVEEPFVRQRILPGAKDRRRGE